MKNWMIIILISFALFVFAGCGEEDQAAPGNLQEITGDEPVNGIEGSRGILYRVNGGDNNLYLFGSIHFGREDMYPLHDAVYSAFREADVLGMELDLTDMTDREVLEEILEIGLYRDGSRLTDLVPEEIFERYVLLVEGFGYDRDILDHFKPWFAAFELSALIVMDAGYDPELGVEIYLMELAEEEGMEVLGLETISSQLDPFSKLSAESQVLYLQNTIADMREAGEELDEIFTHWEKGNIEPFARDRKMMIEQAETESLREFHLAFLDGRDEMMTEKIIELLHDDTGNTYFLAVGAMHLVGDNSIVDRLEKSGYDVEDVYR